MIFLFFIYPLNPASVEFAEDARRQGRRRIRILQALTNTADSAKSTLPEGKLFANNQTLTGRLELVYVIQPSVFYNPLISILINSS